MPLVPGTTLGPYQVTAQIGAGGMGEVYRARDTTLDRDVALKVLPAAFTTDPDRLARFEREAKVLASLDHPNIAGIHGLQESGDGTFRALVLELVEGPTLADRIAEGAIPVAETLAIATQIAEALEAAHEHGVIHRDLKPANIKLRPDGTVKVLDFGLAKALQPEARGADASLSPTISLTAAATQLGMVVGTAAYMAPEQAAGKPVDRRADVWAFGVVLYEMLTGTRPFTGDDVSKTLARVIDRDPDWDRLPAALPPVLRSVLRGCLEKDPRERVRDVGDVGLALRGRFDVHVSPTTGAGAAIGWPAMQVTGVATAAAVVAALVAGGAVWSLRAPNEAPRAVSRFAIDLPGSMRINTRTASPVAITRDGRRLVFNGESTDGPQIYVRSLDDLDAAPIRGTAGTVGSVFLSPDGEWVAFNDTTDNTFKRVRLAGGPPATITGTGVLGGGFQGATWGPRGMIVFATAAAAGLMQVPDVGGPASPLTTPDGETHSMPHFLPDGRALLFTVEGGDDVPRIAVLEIDSGETTTLLDGSAPQFAASGHLLFVREAAVWAVPFDPGRRELTGTAVPVLERVSLVGLTAGATAAKMSVADGGTLVYVEGDAGRTLVRVDRVGREEPIPGLPPDRYEHVDVSPDGTRLALAGTGDGDIWIYDLRRETLTRLTTDPALDQYPLWTPDGSHVVFESARGGQPELFAIAADGASPSERILSGDPTLMSLSPTGWTPDGSTLLYNEVATAAADVTVRALDRAGATEPVVATAGRDWAAAISPDGRWIAYSSDVSGLAQVYVQRYPDLGGRRQISVDGGSAARWSPDGATLFYMGVRGRGVFAVAVDSDAADPWGAPARLFEGDYLSSGGPNRTLAVAPDGGLVVIKPATADGGVEGATDLVVVQNWFTELERLVPTR